MSYLGGDYAGGSLVTNAVAGTASRTGPGPDAKAIVDGYRTNGSLDTERLAKAIYEQSGGDMDKAQAFKSALAGELGPLERGEVDRALGRQDGVSLFEHYQDMEAQKGKALWDTAKGLGSLAWSTVKTSYDTNLMGLAFDKLEARTGTQMPDWLPSAERGTGRLEAGKDAVVGLGKAVWEDPSILIGEYKRLAAEGRYGAIVGQVQVDVADLLLGPKGAGKAGKVARAAGAVDTAADVTRVAKAADSASELARTVRAVPGGADDAADALKATRAALDEIDVAGLPDDVAQKVETARADLVDAQASALWGTDPVTAASLKTGVSREAIFRVIDTPKGQRPPVTDYLSAADVEKHLATFDDGIVRVTSRRQFQKYETLGPSGGFVLPEKQFNGILEATGGDVAELERRLGFDQGYLSSDDVMIVRIDRSDAPDLNIPTGNEGGANRNWIPGGYTSGGVREAVMDFPEDLPYAEINLGR